MLLFLRRELGVLRQGGFFALVLGALVDLFCGVRLGEKRVSKGEERQGRDSLTATATVTATIAVLALEALPASCCAARRLVTISSRWISVSSSVSSGEGALARRRRRLLPLWERFPNLLFLALFLGAESVRSASSMSLRSWSSLSSSSLLGVNSLGSFSLTYRIH